MVAGVDENVGGDMLAGNAIFESNVLFWNCNSIKLFAMQYIALSISISIHHLSTMTFTLMTQGFHLNYVDNDGTTTKGDRFSVGSGSTFACTGGGGGPSSQVWKFEIIQNRHLWIYTVSSECPLPLPLCLLNYLKLLEYFSHCFLFNYLCFIIQLHSSVTPLTSTHTIYPSALPHHKAAIEYLWSFAFVIKYALSLSLPFFFAFLCS